LHGNLKSSGRTERLGEEFKRRITTVLPPELVEEGGNSSDVVLGFAGFSPDHSAQGGRLAKPLNKTPSNQSVNLVRLEIGQINSNTNRDGTELFRCGQLYVRMTVRKSFGKTLGNF
jgi:hypothetical protein